MKPSKTFIPKEAAGFVQKHKTYKRCAVIFVCLALVVALGTMLGLRLYGQAMTKQVRVFDCAVGVHQHDDSCYAEVDGERVLICGEADFVVHAHNSDCYDLENDRLVCQLPEIKEHEHDDSCYVTARRLACGREELSAHTHSEDCYRQVEELVCGKAETEGHAHGPQCYEIRRELVCGLEEIPEGDPRLHTHTDACYEEEKALVCQEREIALHTHTDECYTPVEELGDGADLRALRTVEQTDGETGGTRTLALTCGKVQVLEHIHTEAGGCFHYEAVGADGETPDESDPGSEPVKYEHSQTVWVNDKLQVTAAYNDDAGIPEGVQLVAGLVEEGAGERIEEAKDALSKNDLKVEESCDPVVLNIGFFGPDGAEFEPRAPVSITVQMTDGDGLPDGEPVTVVRLPKEGTGAGFEITTGSDVKNGSTTFTTGG